ncbi:aspartate--tRNA(Asn) ligase [Candidatus Kaiserbacteria bacterium RIFCSPHIGHO2_01_FULL_55_17]|uniref:Aspartate--tRNA(Asp/Asn) ligase n=1 Tax=Candidatus Kaiserbacteria bacterium RIFCSPHIGHO2_01_FULL_55_17 TaxID=1798484 RepID=A0A1F6D944_9BACT|nr:MAG: aspartate--tRNA(Asn) ligase [Candidatus Kaiserbacteria bacterium RIFCSPHIGHO2_01_FULL_55_17]
MERTLNKDLPGAVGKTAKIAGWVDVRRDHGKLIFLDIRDRSGIVQVVVTPKAPEALEAAKELRAQWVVELEGEVKERAEKMRGEGPLGGVEVAAQTIRVLSKAQELPFELDTEVNIDTYLDHLPLTLRSKRSRDVFTMKASILEAYRASLRKQEFTEFVAPALVGQDSEGGGAAFQVEYFQDKTAYLAVSPQLYKQIMVGPFERAFTIAKVFRAEKSATTRHLSEITQMDFEMGFIESEREPMAVLEAVVRDVVSAVSEQYADMFARFGTTVPLLSKEIPILTLKEALEKLGKKEAPDMEPEDERGICEWAKKEKKSDFVFITRFPTKKRAFYTYEDPSEAPYSRGFDLLFRGLEINSGSQRIHDYDTLVARMKERGLDPEKFSFYLQAFKYGLPPHGGSSTGLERFTARMLELANVKEATAFPRDMHRIDTRLSE